MFGEVIRLWENGEYSYPLACGFVPNLVSYIHEDEKNQTLHDHRSGRWVSICLAAGR